MACFYKKACESCQLLPKGFVSSEKTEIQVCARCVCDTSIPGIAFDENGVCQFCKTHEFMDRLYPAGPERQRSLEELMRKVKSSGKGRRYDCIVGVSGGRDSTYLMYVAVKNGLRPLAVHFDSGWNSEIAVTNIKNATEALKVDLWTHVAEWEEFKELQKSFLKASVSDVDIPTDMAIFGALHNAAAREGVKYILNGHSFRTEGIVPKTWTYMDGRYINSVHRRFSGRSKKSVPNFTLADLICKTLLRGIKVVPLLNYVDYRHAEIEKVIVGELGWRNYGGHHHECLYTHFIQSCYLPAKFGIDKRKIELSASVREGVLARDEALSRLAREEYSCDPELVKYVLKKLDFELKDFELLMTAPRKSFRDYPNYYGLMKFLARPIKIACEMGILPELLYQKYLAKD